MREVLFKITENCPGNCTFCDAKEKYEKIFKDTTIKLQDWLKISKDLIENGLEVAIISGGEALLDCETTFELIEYLQKNDVYVVLNTSGVLFNNNILLDKLKVNYPDLLVFSVDSAYSLNHDKNRNMPGVFNKIIKSIKYLKESGDYPIAIRTVITKNNYIELPKIIYDFNSLGVDCIKLTNIENDTEGNFRLNYDELNEFDKVIRNEMIEVLSKCRFQDDSLRKEAINKIRNLLSSKKKSYSDLSSGIFEPFFVGNTNCSLIERFITIQSNGVVLPCCESEHHYSPVLGNLVESSLKEIISTDTYKKLLKNRQDYCVKCTEWENMQINFSYTGKKVAQR